MLARSRTLGSADRAIGVIRTDQLGERVGDAHWRSARLSERGGGMFTSLALAYRPRDALLQFPKFQAGIIAPLFEFIQKSEWCADKDSNEPSNYCAGACAIGARIGAGGDDHHRRRHDRHRTDPDRPDRHAGGESCAVPDIDSAPFLSIRLRI